MRKLPFLVSFTAFVVALFFFTQQAKADGNSCEPQIKYVTVTKYVYRDRVRFVEKKVIKDVTKKNRLYLIAGDGPSDNLNVQRATNGATISSGNEAYLGVGYMRDIGRFNIGIKYQSNEDVAITGGLSW